MKGKRGRNTSVEKRLKNWQKNATSLLRSQKKEKPIIKDNVGTVGKF